VTQSFIQSFNHRVVIYDKSSFLLHDNQSINQCYDEHRLLLSLYVRII